LQSLFSVPARKLFPAFFVRIQNSSATSFDEIKVANISYGKIDASTTSDYKLITAPLYVPGCNVSLKDSSFYIGSLFCRTSAPPTFESGYYTFIIKPSITYPGLHDIESKKE